MIPMANHLWQSTLFAAAAWMLTLLLRSNRAQTRYCIWFAASVKFLIPFALLMDLGNFLGRHETPVAAASLPYVIEQASRPFTPALLPMRVPTPVETSYVSWI